jgi:uncharacterized protein YbjT (DUF2867 family)
MKAKMAGRVLVLGATGSVGSAVLETMNRRGQVVVAATRQPEAMAAARPADLVTWVRFDYDDPATFEPALAGIDRVFLMVRPGDEASDRTAIPFIHVMERTGVRHVVALTAMGSDQVEGSSLRRIERRLEASRLEWTHLRPNFFMQIFSRPPLLTSIRATGGLRLPAGEGALSFIDVRDIAEVAATVLTESSHTGKAYALTGPDALTHAHVAALISTETGRTIRYEAVDEDTAKHELSAAGFTPARVDRLLGFYAAVRSGWCAPLSTAVADILGRPPVSMARFARDHRRVWMED